MKFKLEVVIEASTSEEIESCVHQLVRSACDIANSSNDENCHVTVVTLDAGTENVDD